MRYSTLLPLAAASVSAIVIPDAQIAQQLVALESDEQRQTTPSKWFDSLRSTADDTLDAISWSTHSVLEGLSSTVDVIGDVLRSAGPDSVFDEDDIFGINSKPRNGHVGRPGHHDTTNLTVYQSIKASKYSTKFAKLVDRFPDLVKRLNQTESNVTAFVPIDRAFDKIPEGHKEPSDEFVASVMKYHILDGYYTAGRVLAHHTLPTSLDSQDLGDRPQRLRVSFGLFGVRLNFYSKIVAANLFTKNGMAHAVDSILVPPPPAATLISLFPSRFSTLELAAEKTGLTHHKDDGKKSLTGLTIFAPTNFAFQKLGPRANAFLFNTERGLGYLRALLKYHIVANETLYSDAYYGDTSMAGYYESLEHNSEYVMHFDSDEQNDSEESRQSNTRPGYYHVDLPTLLGKNLAVDIVRHFGMITMRLNGYTRVAIEDGVAKDGVVHTLNSVLIPPREHKKDNEDSSTGSEEIEEQGEISVEELVERLRPYVEDDSAEGLEGLDLGGEMLGHEMKEQVWGEL